MTLKEGARCSEDVFHGQRNEITIMELAYDKCLIFIACIYGTCLTKEMSDTTSLQKEEGKVFQFFALQQPIRVSM